MFIGFVEARIQVAQPPLFASHKVTHISERDIFVSDLGSTHSNNQRIGGGTTSRGGRWQIAGRHDWGVKAESALAASLGRGAYDRGRVAVTTRSPSIQRSPSARWAITQALTCDTKVRRSSRLSSAFMTISSSTFAY